MEVVMKNAKNDWSVRIVASLVWESACKQAENCRLKNLTQVTCVPNM